MLDGLVETTHDPCNELYMWLFVHKISLVQWCPRCLSKAKAVDEQLLMYVLWFQGRDEEDPIWAPNYQGIGSKIILLLVMDSKICPHVTYSLSQYAWPPRRDIHNPLTKKFYKMPPFVMSWHEAYRIHRKPPHVTSHCEKKDLDLCCNVEITKPLRVLFPHGGNYRILKVFHVSILHEKKIPTLLKMK